MSVKRNNTKTIKPNANRFRQPVVVVVGGKKRGR